MQNRYLVFSGVKQVELHEACLALPGAGAALVRSEYTFISAGTELANLTGAEPAVFRPGSWCAYPWRPGYAQVGRVQAVGPGFERAMVGDRVFTLGGHADYAVLTNEDLIVPVPEEVVLLGSPRAPCAGDITGLLSDIHLRNLTLHGALEWSLPAAQPPGFNNPVSRPVRNLTDKQQMIFDWLRDGRLIVRPLVSHVVKPGDVAAAYTGLLEQPGCHTGVAIDWREAQA